MIIVRADPKTTERKTYDGKNLAGNSSRRLSKDIIFTEQYSLCKQNPDTSFFPFSLLFLFILLSIAGLELQYCIWTP